MDEVTRFITNLVGRLDGPLHFRFILQPTMAIALAVRDGLRDEREAKPAYLLSLFTNSRLRPMLIRSGWRTTWRLIFLALLLDVSYQLVFLHWFYPLETVIVAVLLAMLPYALTRGIVNRLDRAISGAHGSSTVSNSTSSGGRLGKS